MRGLVLACGRGAPEIPAVTGLEVVPVPERPGKADVDPVLGEHDRVIVAGTDADLAAVVVRLLRKDRLAAVTVGFVPAGPESAVASLWQLPVDPRRALALAVEGEVDPVPLIRDDSGGVLLGRGSVGPVRGVAYCDDEVALRGAARSIVVEPDDAGGPGLVARVTKGLLFKRPVTVAGRAFQLGCVPAVPTLDGVAHPRAVNRWTWYRHTEDLRLIRGLL
ncbi:hypothetical protein [Amycolatopsis nigrescens]|uniref:hypothetical protein n=1 Tax=Amycolatopsis nigrescens TaxID=381445 RepID=UPI0003748AB2|nr:hypothetical protein [Amycolatopsis nigrescens]